MEGPSAGTTPVQDAQDLPHVAQGQQDLEDLRRRAAAGDRELRDWLRRRGLLEASEAPTGGHKSRLSRTRPRKTGPLRPRLVRSPSATPNAALWASQRKVHSGVS